MEFLRAQAWELRSIAESLACNAIGLEVGSAACANAFRFWLKGLACAQATETRTQEAKSQERQSRHPRGP